MKKSLLVLFTSATLVFVAAFGLMSLTNGNDGKEFTSEYETVEYSEITTIDGEETEFTFTEDDVWEHFEEKMSPELSRFVSYDEGEIFSRCPSGMSQFFDYEESFAQYAVGEVVVWEGCVDQHYCYYKVDMDNRETFLKKNEEDDYMAMVDFVEMEKERTMAKF